VASPTSPLLLLASLARLEERSPWTSRWRTLQQKTMYVIYQIRHTKCKKKLIYPITISTNIWVREPRLSKEKQELKVIKLAYKVMFLKKFLK
jgi:hypothetical protein